MRMRDGLRLGRGLELPGCIKTDGTCEYCRSGAENLCDNPLFTGIQRGWRIRGATSLRRRFCLSDSGGICDEQAAPLLCAGIIGFGRCGSRA